MLIKNSAGSIAADAGFDNSHLFRRNRFRIDLPLGQAAFFLKGGFGGDQYVFVIIGVAQGNIQDQQRPGQYNHPEKQESAAHIAGNQCCYTLRRPACHRRPGEKHRAQGVFQRRNQIAGFHQLYTQISNRRKKGRHVNQPHRRFPRGSAVCQAVYQKRDDLKQADSQNKADQYQQHRAKTDAKVRVEGTALEQDKKARQKSHLCHADNSVHQDQAWVDGRNKQ